jgi:hypothetical protein
MTSLQEIRCLIDIGDIRSPLAIRHSIERIVCMEVRTRVEKYLTMFGVLVGRALPPGWFQWLDADTAGTDARKFVAQCSDPPPSGAPDDGYQPWNYLVVGDIYDRSNKPWRAIGLRFMHYSDTRINSP